MTEPLPPLPNPDGFLPPDGFAGGVLDNEPEGAVDVLLVDEGEGTWSQSDSHRYRLTFRVAMTDPLATAFDVLSTGEPLPQMGGSFCRYEWSDTTRKWTIAGVIDAHSVCIDRQARRDPANSNWWLVVCEFEGRTDPTAEPPQVSYDEVPFTEHDVRDYWGGLVANAARDPIEGGMPVDRAYSTLTLVRNIPYEKWDPNLANRFRHTRNKKPFRHSNLVSFGIGAIAGGVGAPIVADPGTAKLSRLSATRLVRAPGSTPDPVAPGGSKSASKTSYYWQLRAQIDFDDVTFPRKDGTRERRLHRWVALNAGYRKLAADGTRSAIFSTASKPTHPPLLDAQGQPLSPPPDQPPTMPEPVANLLVFPSNSTAFETQESTELRVVSPGLFGLAPGAVGVELIPSAANGGVGQTKGAVELLDQTTNPGGWKYTPNSSQVGWDFFGYMADGALTASPRAKGYVAILISPRPVYLAFDRYGLADWDEIASWIGNW